MNRSIKYNPYLLSIFTGMVFLCLCLNGSAQNKDTSAYQLIEILILQNKQQLIESSKKNFEIDSLTLSKYSTTSLAELLANQSTIHIKSYGNGNIASASMRGGNANHTAILWNGFNIQNPRLGMTDLSIVPAILFDNVYLEYGGGSALWGSGALGGSVYLQNKIPFNSGFRTKVQMNIGSFNTKKIGTSILFSNKKISSQTRVYYNSSDNNYPYKDTSDKENPVKQITHANYYTSGLLQEFALLIGSYQKVNIKGWYNKTDRNLPPSSYYSISKKNQKDENLKLSADWNYEKQNFKSVVKAAYFNDLVNYSDSTSNTHSRNYAKTFITENDNIYFLRKHTFNFGINYTNYNSHSIHQTDIGDVSYINSLNKFALFAAYKLNLLDSKFNYNLVIRKEFTDRSVIPFTGNTGIRYQVTKWLALKVNGSKSYRQPSLDDLYWPGAGNPDLKPEESYEGDGGIEIKFSKKLITATFEGNYFNRHTTDWIIWLPTTSSTNWTPRNIAEVYSRGTDTKTELSFTKNDFQTKLIVTTAYVLSTNLKSKNENDNSIGRQLIYTPRYNGQASLVIRYQTFSLLFNNNYTGYRFTSTDNTSWLYPYYLANLKISYGHIFNNTMVELFGSINNMFNKSYLVVANNPMPLRNYEFGMTLQYYKKPKDKNKQIE